MTARLSRRGFLGSILAAGAYAAGGRLFAAAPEDFDENLAIFLSDVHVSGNNAPDPKTGKLEQTYSRDWLKASVAEILQMRPLPRHVLVFGDLAYLIGRKMDYLQSQPDLKLLVDAGIKLTIGMGNHDHRSSFLEVWPEYAERTRVPGNIVSVASLRHADFIMLDSLNETTGPGEWNPVPGALRKEEQDWLAANLPTWPRPFFLGAHHPFHELKVGKKERPIRDLFPKFPNFAGYVHGHDHFWKHGMIDWHKAQSKRWLCLPSNGLWGDIGYVKFRVEPHRAVASLVQKDCFHPRPLPKAERNPAWDLQLAENRGQTFTFAF